MTGSLSNFGIAFTLSEAHEFGTFGHSSQLYGGFFMLLGRELMKMEEEMLMNMEIGHVMDLLNQCLSPMEQLQCYLAAQQGYLYEVAIQS